MSTLSLPIGFRGSAIDVTSEQGRAFLQERVALFARAMAMLMLVQMVTMGLTTGLMNHAQPVNTWTYLLAGIAVLGMLGISRYAARSTWGRRVASFMDVACVTDPAALLALNVYLNRDLPIAPFMGFIFVGFLVFGRALIIPSSGGRTMLVSLAGFAPMVGTQLYMARVSPESQVVAPEVQSVAITTTAVLASGLASYGSWIISGLREEVHKAKQLGQYILQEKIGEGAMGIVYRAKHAMLRRPTAVKLLPPEKTGDLAARRFEREVQLTSELHHPNTVHIYDYGRSADGIFYYAMELLEGIELESLVEDDGPQPPERVAYILRQICGSLQEAHDRGLIHRDVKPANVFLCHLAGMPDVVKVLDFGLVKELDRGDRAALTEVDVIAGTPAYLAPETITDPDEVGPGVDLYALGALGYFLLTGEDVFTGKTVVEVCSHHLHTAPEPPSSRIGRSIDPELEAVILRLLAKDPDDRFASARALARHLAELEVSERWGEPEAERWWGRNHPELRNTPKSTAKLEGTLSPEAAPMEATA